MAKTANFESLMKELETITKQLENNETSLDDAIKHFERGVSLADECNKILNAAEEKVVKILKDSDKGETEVLFEE